METPPVERNGNTSARMPTRAESDSGTLAAPCGLSTVAEVTAATVTSSVTDTQPPDQTDESSPPPAVQVYSPSYLILFIYK